MSLADHYARGIDAAYAKMVARVGEEEAAKWRAGSLNAAQMYAQRYDAVRRRPPSASRRAEAS